MGVGGDKGKFEDEFEDLESGDGVEGKNRDDVGKNLAVRAKLQIKMMKKNAKVERKVPKAKTKLELGIEMM